jgi:mono/diheme cytochrome c family protein
MMDAERTKHRRHGRAKARSASSRRCPGHPRLWFCSAALILLLVLSPFAARAQSAAHFSPFFRFTEQSGEQLFANVCQGCHMPDAKGAVGAGTYPSLAANKNLEAGGYPVYVIVRGQRAMPPFGAMMSDDQIAAVVNYLRTHFGNDYKDAVTAEDVKVVRP